MKEKLLIWLRQMWKQTLCRLGWHVWDEQRLKQENPDGSFSYEYHAKCKMCGGTIDLEINSVTIIVEKE